MNGCIAIDFEPRSGAAPHILRMISAEGMDLCGLHMVPSCAERSTLMVDPGWMDREQMVDLENRLRGLAGVLDVIHMAASQPGAPAREAPRAAA